MIGPQRLPRDLGEAAEQKRRQFLAADADADGLQLGGGEGDGEVVGLERRAHRRAERERCRRRRASSVPTAVRPPDGIVHAGRHGLAARTHVEGGELVGAVADHRHTVRFENLQRARDVEDALGADDGDGSG